MENRAEFLEKLNGLVNLAKKNDNWITVEEVKLYFSEIDLTEEQIELVFDYLLAQKVVVKGYLKMAEEAKEEIAFTEEEEAYLKEYLKDLGVFQNVAEEEKEVLFARMLQGDKEAKNRLIGIYLPEVVEIAKQMYKPDIFLGDIIQEGNMGLLLGLEMISDVESAHDTIIAQIRQSIRTLMEEEEELCSRDKQMVEKVSLLDDSIKTLTEELGRKVTIDELAVYMGMTEEEIMDILRLTGEETEEEEKHEE